MREETDEIQIDPVNRRPLDRIDRKLLGALARDATLSYAQLGEIAGLSAPATHERVKRLKASGRIKATVSLIDADAAGKPLLAFIHVDTIGWGKTPEMLALSQLPEVEEIHAVTGDTCIILKARCASTQALEGLLGRLYAQPGVKGTRSYIVLSTHMERPTQAEISPDLPIRNTPSQDQHHREAGV